MLKVGDFVSYRSEGVCVIADIRDESFNTMGKSEKYYILAPLHDKNSKLYIPVSNELLTSQMMPLLSEEELRALIDEISSERLEWISDSRARSAGFKSILSTGERKSLIVLVNTIGERLSVSNDGKRRCTAGDENIYKKAKKILYDEFSQTVHFENEEEFLALLSGK